MSPSNVELVRRTYDEWAQGNMKAGIELFDPEIAFQSFMPDASDRVLARGPQAIESFMREFLAQWRHFRIVGEEFRPVGDDKVLVTGHQSALGRHSGVVTSDSLCSVWTFRDGRVIELVFDRDREEALAAAGLSR